MTLSGVRLIDVGTSRGPMALARTQEAVGAEGHTNHRAIAGRTHRFKTMAPTRCGPPYAPEYTTMTSPSFGTM